MSERVFCIDFGSAYTKIGLRRGKWNNSELVTDSRLRLDELRVCVPSTVAIDQSQGSPTWYYGEEAENLPQSGRVRLFKNWKRFLFLVEHQPPAPVATPPPAPIRQPSRLETLFQSADFGNLAAKYGVTSAEIHSLRRLLAHAVALGASTTHARPEAPTPSRLTPAESAHHIAIKYFKWLRTRVLEACKNLKPELKNPELVPVRFSVPAFSPDRELLNHQGCQRLIDALKKAEWPLKDHLPVVAEPHANSIGVLTRGSNCNRVRDMFQNGPLIRVLADPEHHPDYRVVVIDVGAFTTDFAVLTFRSGGKRHVLDEVEFENRTLSVPLGISTLDEAFLAAIRPDQAKHLRERAAAIEWVDLRPKVYAERQPFPHDEIGEIGGGADAIRVEEAITSYTLQLSEQTAAFLGGLDDIPMKELVLTGGGCTIPAIQDALISGAEFGASKFRKIHLPSVRIPGKQKVSTPQQVITPLDGKLNRGATALGGASVYFELNRN